MDIPQNVAQVIGNAARRVAVAKAMIERARTWEEKRALEIELEAAEREMQDAAMRVNRGLERNVSPAA